MVGSIECLLIEDGRDASPPDFYFANAPTGELEGLMRGRVDTRGMVVAPANCLLVRSGAKLALVDAGFGAYAAHFHAEAGGLQEALRAGTVPVDEVETVLVTHAHPDHLGGLVSAGKPVFPRARHVMSASEWRFWTMPESFSALPEFMRALMREVVEAQLLPLDEAGLLEPIDDAAEILPGVRMVDAPGHTPGHTAIEIASGGEHALFLADAVLHELNFEHPEWVCAADLDADLTVETRKWLLERAVAVDALVFATHLDKGGKVQRSDEAYRFVSSP